jgi:hypothetical protein
MAGETPRAAVHAKPATAARVMPFGGREDVWLRARDAAILRGRHGEADLVVVERTGFGWIRWEAGTGASDVTDAWPVEVGVFAPACRSTARKALFALWGPSPVAARAYRAYGVPDSVIPGAALFFVAAAVLAPHLRGATALTVPLALAVVVTGGVPMVLRRGTRTRVRVVTGRGWAARQVHRVLAAHQVLTSRPRSCGPLAVEIAGPARVARELVWRAAGEAREIGRWRELAATVCTATAVAQGGAAAGECWRIHEPGGLARCPRQGDVPPSACRGSDHAGRDGETAACL